VKADWSYGREPTIYFPPGNRYWLGGLRDEVYVGHAEPDGNCHV